MKWEKWGDYAIKTATHSISKAKVNGKEIYTLWELPDTMIGNYATANDAKTALIGLLAASGEGIAMTTNTSLGRKDD